MSSVFFDFSGYPGQTLPDTAQAAVRCEMKRLGALRFSAPVNQISLLTKERESLGRDWVGWDPIRRDRFSESAVSPNGEIQITRQYTDQ